MLNRNDSSVCVCCMERGSRNDRQGRGGQALERTCVTRRKRICDARLIASTRAMRRKARKDTTRGRMHAGQRSCEELELKLKLHQRAHGICTYRIMHANSRHRCRISVPIICSAMLCPALLCSAVPRSALCAHATLRCCVASPSGTPADISLATVVETCFHKSHVNGPNV